MYDSTKRHISNALELFSNRENPDYINSIKESISAVESALNYIFGKDNLKLSQAINMLPFVIDEHFHASLKKLYSYTS